MKDPLEYNARAERWAFTVAGRKHGGYRTKLEAAKAYCAELVKKEPRFKPLVEGKPWPEVFRILGIHMERRVR